uniref:Uncharacterized protein n=1 Tax=Oryza punctata TaxID=4537 RepID=A0A0E0LT49_ORYPU
MAGSRRISHYWRRQTLASIGSSTPHISSILYDGLLLSISFGSTPWETNPLEGISWKFDSLREARLSADFGRIEASCRYFLN